MCFQTLGRLFSPLRYLKIVHEAKRVYDVWLPLLLSLLSTIALFALTKKPPLFGATGVVTYISEILKFLSPFYIAAMAAIATCNSQMLDARFDGNAPYLVEKFRGELRRVELNRRQFLCLAFGYLALVSLGMYFFGYIAWIISFNFWHSELWYLVCKIVFVFAYLLVFYNVLMTTLLGLFYLSDKLHRGD